MLYNQGKSCHQIGPLTLELRDILLSPNSSCTIISAGKLKSEHGIVASAHKELLVKVSQSGKDIPIAKLVNIDNVLYIEPLEAINNTTSLQAITAIAVSRLPKTTNAQRWHQRLGHLGQKILKKTAQHSTGLEGINFNGLTTCETCHLSKAQRYVSREPKLMPSGPLDEIFIDTVGKVIKAINGHQYAVILTDAKTRMRWAITTHTKDQIAQSLVDWIKLQHNQFGKRVRIIFCDGGSEFTHTRDYCV